MGESWWMNDYGPVKHSKEKSIHDARRFISSIDLASRYTPCQLQHLDIRRVQHLLSALDKQSNIPLARLHPDSWEVDYS